MNTRVLPEEALKRRNFGVLAILKLENVTEKVRNSLTALLQAFQHVFEYGHVHIMGDMGQPPYNEACPCTSLVYTVISLQTMQHYVFSPKFHQLNFLR